MNKTEWLLGVHSVEAALKYDANNIVEILVEQGHKNHRVQALVDDAKARGLSVHGRSKDALEKVAHGERFQHIAALYNTPEPRNENDLPELIEQAGERGLFLILDGVTDPHNFGACLRTACAAGVTAVIVPKDKASGITPTVRRASAGAADRVPVLQVTNLARSMEVLKKANVWITGLEGEAEQTIQQCDLNGKVAIVLGSEGEGMRRLTRERCDFLAKIFMPGEMESLNVSVATGIVLFEAVRQRQNKK